MTAGRDRGLRRRPHRRGRARAGDRPRRDLGRGLRRRRDRPAAGERRSGSSAHCASLRAAAVLTGGRGTAAVDLRGAGDARRTGRRAGAGPRPLAARAQPGRGGRRRRGRPRRARAGGVIRARSRRWGRRRRLHGLGHRRVGGPRRPRRPASTSPTPSRWSARASGSRPRSRGRSRVASSTQTEAEALIARDRAGRPTPGARRQRPRGRGRDRGPDGQGRRLRRARPAARRRRGHRLQYLVDPDRPARRWTGAPRARHRPALLQPGAGDAAGRARGRDRHQPTRPSSAARRSPSGSASARSGPRTARGSSSTCCSSRT